MFFVVCSCSAFIESAAVANGACKPLHRYPYVSVPGWFTLWRRQHMQTGHFACVDGQSFGVLLQLRQQCSNMSLLEYVAYLSCLKETLNFVWYHIERAFFESTADIRFNGALYKLA